jgi:E3 ubiquitin-protein ligase MGRN1
VQPPPGQFYGPGFRPPFPGPVRPPPGPPQRPPPPPPPTQELTQTATIRNAVNLKRSSLAATPVPGSEHLLTIRFTFDASSPCCATTFIAATEDAVQGCKLSTAKQAPGPAVNFPKGLGHKFPGVDASEVSAGHSIDTSLYHEDTLLSNTKDSYPLIIRLETITERGLREGHTLEVRN